jgi:transcriptional regulator with XRE-family HTH domain
MDLYEYVEKARQDPEYRQAERELRPYLDIANDVLALRLERGWSQTELARRAGTKQANVSRIESGVANPTVKTLQKLAEALGTEVQIRLAPADREGTAEVAESLSASSTAQRGAIMTPAPA